MVGVSRVSRVARGDEGDGGSVVAGGRARKTYSAWVESSRLRLILARKTAAASLKREAGVSSPVREQPPRWRFLMASCSALRAAVFDGPFFHMRRVTPS